MPKLHPIFEEIAAIERFRMRDDEAKSFARSYTPSQAIAAASMARLFPSMRPGVLTALSKAGYQADDPVVGLAGQTATKQDLDRPGQYGEPMKAARLAPGQANMESGEDKFAVPQWVGDNPEARDLFRMAKEAGQVQHGVIVAHEPGDLPNAEEPFAQSHPDVYASRDIINRLTALGVKVPVIKRGADMGPFFAVPHESQAESDYKYKLERVGKSPRPGSAAWRAYMGTDQETGGSNEFAGVGQGLINQTPGAKQVSADVEGYKRLDEADSPALQAVTAPTQGLFMAMDAPIQETQGLFRAAVTGKMPQFQSDLAVKFAHPSLSSGDGWFVDPESAVADERRRRERSYGTVGGHSITFGRWVTDTATWLRPDTKPFLIMSGLLDAGAQLYADPTAKVLSKAGEAGEASRFFHAAEDNGGVLRSALRPFFRDTDGAAWLNSGEGNRTLDWLAGNKDSYEIWRRMGRNVSPDFAQQLADAPDSTAVRQILEPALGTSIPKVNTVSMVPKIGDMKPVDVSRLRGELPLRQIRDAWDPQLVGEEIEMHLRNVKAPHKVISEQFEQAARARTPIELNRAVTDTMGRVDGLLDNAGVKDQGLRRQLTRLYEDTHKEAQRTFDDIIGSNVPTHDGVMVSQERRTDLGAHLYVEHAPRTLPMPDPRPLRRLTSKYPTMFGERAFVRADGQARFPLAAAEFFQNELWKPFALMRAAWPIRVIGEEQVRMAAAGYDSVFHHPVSFISWRTGKKGEIDVVKNMIEESIQHKDAAAAAHGDWVERPNQVRMGHTTYQKGVDEFDRWKEGWASELATLHHDPVANHLANSGSIDETAEWFTRGAGNKYRGGLATAHPGEFDTLPQAREYIESVQRRLDNAVGGNETIAAAVKTGKLGEHEVINGTRLNRHFVSALDEHADSGPDVVRGDLVKTLRSGKQGNRVMAEWDRTVDWAFGHLMTKRTNNLSRSPVFKQKYWREAERLIGFADDETKAKIVDAAKDANLGSRTIRRMERAKAAGALGLDEVDLLAKGQALDETKFLLYDLSKKGQFMDAARLVFPFGEAWKEVIGRWGGLQTLGAEETGLAWRHPQSFRRFQQVVQGARGEDFGKVMGAPPGKGFFWKNDHGEEMFMYPGSQLLSSGLIGVPVPLTGRVQGLSMFGTVIPGLGPIAQIPTAWVLENKPGPEWMKQALFTAQHTKIPGLNETVEQQLVPFGAPGSEDQGDLFSALSYLPPYVREAVDWATTGDGSETAYGNSVMDVAAYLDSTGKYGTSREERQRLMDDAARKGRWLFLLTAVGKFAAPASPNRDVQVETDKGLLQLRAVADDFKKMQDDDFENAVPNFVDKYGEDALSATISHTQGVEYGVPTTAEGAQWALMHPQLRTALPHTYGFFAPQKGDMDFRAYNSQFDKGQRVHLTRTQWLDLSNQIKGNVIYQAQKDKIGGSPNDDQRAWLGQWRKFLKDEYPGWASSKGDIAGIPHRPSDEDMVSEMYKALDHKAIRKTDAGKGLALYLQYRDKALAQQKDKGFRRSDGLISSSKDMLDTRRWLNDSAQWVIEQHPDFEPIWEIVFSHEAEVRAEDQAEAA